MQTTNSSIADAIAKGNIALSNASVATAEGTVVLEGSSEEELSDLARSADGEEGGAMVVNLYNNAGKMTKVGYTYNEGGTSDLSSLKSAVILQGNNAYDANGKAIEKTGSSTLLGGTGNDTVFAGSTDVVDAGAGVNRVVLQESRNADADSGVEIKMTNATGRNMVENFSTGFGDANDGVVVSDIDSTKFKLDDEGNVIITNGRAKTTLSSAAEKSADGEGYSAQVAIIEDDEEVKIQIIGEDTTVVVSDEAEERADRYIGTKSGLDFTEFSGDVNISLADSVGTFGEDTVNVSGITKVQLGAGDATLTGTSKADTLTAGVGNSTILSGAGNDKLVGNTSEDKEGRTTFGFIAGYGKDTISGFSFRDAENSGSADRIFTNAEFTVDKITDAGDVVLKFAGNNSDKLTIENAKGKDIQISVNDSNDVTTVLQVGEDKLTYDGIATKYVATSSNASVVADSEAANVNILLSDTNAYEGKIKYLSAAGVEGNATLAGNSYDNVITAANGDTWLWGGGASDDTLIGGEGSDRFFYGINGDVEGNDIISGADEFDIIDLQNIKASDFSAASIDTSTITFVFNSGGSLTLANNGSTFILEGQSWVYDKEKDNGDGTTGGWTQG